MSKKDKQETVKTAQSVETVLAIEPTSSIQNVNPNILITTRDWKRSDALISHLSSIPTWYGKEEKNLITAFKNADGDLEILQGNQRKKALISFDFSEIPVKVYDKLSETERKELSKDIIATGLTKLDVYRSLFGVLSGLKTTTAWLKAIAVVSLQQLTHTTKPKSGNLDWSDKEKTSIIKNKSGKNKMQHDEAVACALLTNRWQGMRQSIDALCGVSVEIAELFQYGLLVRNTGFFAKLPASAIITKTTEKEDGTKVHSFTVNFDDAELQKCAELGTDDYALLKESVLFEKPAKAIAEVALIDVDVDMVAFAEYIAVDSDMQERLYTMLTASSKGVKLLEDFNNIA